MADIFQEYFVNPILVNGWFNPVNTLLWGLILVVAAFLVYARLLRKMRVKVDRYFALAILPFVFWASSTRVLRDMFYGLARQASAGSPEFLSDIAYQTGLIQQQAFLYISGFIPILPVAGFFSWIVTFFPTPGSYVFTFLFALACLLLGLGIQKLTSKTAHSKGRWPRRLRSAKENEGDKSRLPAIVYWKPMFLTGLVACIINVLMIPLANPWGLGMILGITACFAAVFFSFTFLHEKKIVKWKPLGVFSRPNSSLLSVHMLDSSATFVSVMFFGYVEQHPVPRFFIESAGGWTFFALKLAVLLPSLYIIDKYAEDKEFRTFLKIVILILGLAPGLRDAIRLAAGV
jgi:uncharacterized membrane protein